MIITRRQLEVYRACAKDVLRPVLQTIHITNKHVEATNGFELVRINHDYAQEGESFLLSMNDAKKIIAMLPRGVEAVDISLEPSDSPDLTILVKSIDPDDKRIMPWRCWQAPGNFPNTDRVMTPALDNPLQARVVLSVEQLTKILETAKHSGYSEVELSLHYQDKDGKDPEKWLTTPVAIRSWDQKHIGHTLDALVMPILNN